MFCENMLTFAVSFWGLQGSSACISVVLVAVKLPQLDQNSDLKLIDSKSAANLLWQLGTENVDNDLKSSE